MHFQSFTLNHPFPTERIQVMKSSTGAGARVARVVGPRGMQGGGAERKNGANTTASWSLRAQTGAFQQEGASHPETARRTERRSIRGSIAGEAGDTIEACPR